MPSRAVPTVEPAPYQADKRWHTWCTLPPQELFLSSAWFGQLPFDACLPGTGCRPPDPPPALRRQRFSAGGATGVTWLKTHRHAPACLANTPVLRKTPSTCRPLRVALMW